VNPGTILWQSAVAAATVSAVALFGDPATAVWIAGAAFVVAVALNLDYAHALGAQGRSRRRIIGDRSVARFTVAGLGLPLLLAIVANLADHHPHTALWGFSASEVEALLIAAAMLFAIILVSSLIDWYYVRPRLDGVVGAPPCRSSDWGARKRLTRRWYLHRGIATLSFFGFGFVVALVVMLMLVREHPAAAGVVGGVGGIASLFLIFASTYRSQIPVVAKWALSPAFVLGDDLSYEAHKWAGRGYVLHVAVPVVKLVPLDENGRRTEVPFVERKNTDLAEADLEPRRSVACAGGCVKLNPECLVTESRVDRRVRRLVL
jgi:hypothetical protein